MSDTKDWTSIFETNTDYEADLVRDRLDSAGIDAVVFTQRDHAFNLTIGDLAKVHVMVRPADAGRARATLEETPFTEEELAAAAAAADPDAADAHSEEDEARLDSGNERITFPGEDG
ncbi:MAG: DUF2007 domain-containing protein [Bacteroidota bacterium]